MLTVEELFARLSYGPLSNLAISGEGAGSIIAAKRPAIVHYANEASVRLHGKFLIKEKEVILKIREGVSSYFFRSEHAYTKQTDTSSTYIMDTASRPFQDDLIKVLSVWTGAGCELPLNDLNEASSLFTPQPDMLQVPQGCEDDLLFVLYQAHDKKLSSNPVDLKAVLDIPEVLEEALISYIAHKVLGAMNGQEHMVKAATHLANYDATCSLVESSDSLSQSSSFTSRKFTSRGFV